MSEPIYLKIDRKEDREIVATILYRNGYRVESAKQKNKRSFDYYVKCERIESCEVQDSQTGDGAQDEG